MNEQKIVKIAQAKFLIFWTADQDSGLILDFNPLIDEYKLSGNFCLLHWQAKPFGLRTWGIYDHCPDNYFSFSANAFSFGSISGSGLRTLQINEKIYNTRPTAVISIQDAKLITEDQGKTFHLIEAV